MSKKKKKPAYGIVKVQTSPAGLPIEIDGGVHKENLAEVVRAGCDWIVTGSAIFHSADPEATLREMREIAAQAAGVAC